jgi:hypothetical protein
MMAWKRFAFALLLAAGGCSERDTRFCDDKTFFCMDPAFPYCDVAKGECESMPFDGYVPIDLSGRMDASGSDAAIDLAPMCTASSQCGDATPICASASCRACSGAADDAECKVHNAATPRCGSAGACVACRTTTEATDCAAATPICDATGTCRKCAAHSECSTGICKSDGTCALSTDIAYVDDGGVAPGVCKVNGAMHDGNSPTTAFCDITDAIAGTKPYALVKGSSAAYSGITINNRSIVLVGPGLNATTPATISGGLSSSVSVTGTSVVTIDGFDITTTLLDAVDCVNVPAGAVLTLIRDNIHDVTKIGVNVTTCVLTLDQDVIGPNCGNGAVVLGAGATYSVTNTFVIRNPANTQGITIDKMANGIFQFNTVASNGASNIAGGIDCGTGVNKVIERSIVASNTTTAGGSATQFTGNCVLDDVVVGTAEKGSLGGVKLDPTFVQPSTAPYDYHLKTPNDTANLACCIDKITMTVDGGATMLPDHDIDGTHRPKGAGWDIGGHEAQ